MKSSKRPELGPTSTIIVNTMAHYQTIGGFAQVALPDSSFKISRNCSLVKQRIRFSVCLWTKVNTPFDLLPLCNHKILEATNFIKALKTVFLLFMVIFVFI